ncbi:MAG: NADH-quinone oxidoreductase subunit J [Bacteroidetes bacterium]|nr:NADH-quinone oxidoreductase subunit J [Bacteroidota bacterium]
MLNLYDYIFYFFAIVILGSSFVVVFSRNIVHSAFALLFTFFGVAGFYVLLSADFLAITQLLVYVGGILVLLLFGVMLTNNIVNVEIKSGTMQTLPASLIAALIAGLLCGIFYVSNWYLVPTTPELLNNTTAVAIGYAFITTWILPFEVASVVLLVAMIGAVIIARREKAPEVE